MIGPSGSLGMHCQVDWGLISILLTLLAVYVRCIRLMWNCYVWHIRLMWDWYVGLTAEAHMTVSHKLYTSDIYKIFLVWWRTEIGLWTCSCIAINPKLYGNFPYVKIYIGYRNQMRTNKRKVIMYGSIFIYYYYFFLVKGINGSA